MGHQHLCRLGKRVCFQAVESRVAVADDRSGGNLKDVGESLKSILERVADFFDLFGLSFPGCVNT